MDESLEKWFDDEGLGSRPSADVMEQCQAVILYIISTAQSKKQILHGVRIWNRIEKEMIQFDDYYREGHERAEALLKVAIGRGMEQLD